MSPLILLDGRGAVNLSGLSFFPGGRYNGGQRPRPAGRMGGEPVYRRLLSNTFLFSVSTFGSKLLLFLLTPFYTSVLSQGEYGSPT